MDKQEIFIGVFGSIFSALVGFGFAALLANTTNLYLAFAVGAVTIFLITVFGVIVGTVHVINSLIDSLVKENFDKNEKK